MSVIVLRIRGRPERNDRQERTMKQMRLHAPNHATIVPEDETYKGMMKKVEHFVTYGELDQGTALQLLEARGRAPGNKPLTDGYVAEHTPFETLEDLAQALVDEDVTLNKLDGIKPVFRLHPPRGGFENNKRHFNEGGSLGYRGSEINDLIQRML